MIIALNSITYKINNITDYYTLITFPCLLCRRAGESSPKALFELEEPFHLGNILCEERPLEGTIP